MQTTQNKTVQVRSWKDDRHSVAYVIEPVEDMNEVTHHYLDTIYTHLFNTKGPLPGKASVGGGAAVAQPMNVSTVQYPKRRIASLLYAAAAAAAQSVIVRHRLLGLRAAIGSRAGCGWGFVLMCRVWMHTTGFTCVFQVWLYIYWCFAC